MKNKTLLLAGLLLGLVLPDLRPLVAQEAKAPAGEALAAAAPGGSLEKIEGVQVLFLYGSDRERGHAEGWLLADEITALFRDFVLSPRVIRIPRLWDLLVRPVIKRRMAVGPTLRAWAEGVIAGIRARRPGKLHLGRLGREMDALDILAGAALPDLMGLLCSSFAVWGPATESGHTLVGRNLDYMSTQVLADTIMVKVHAPAGHRHGWVEIGWPGIAGCLSGISDAGVFVALHDVFVKARGSRNGFSPRIVALQDLIEHLAPGADAASRAEARLQSHRLVFGGNALVAWRAGEGAAGACVVEFDGRRDVAWGAVARRPAAHPFIACSNHHRLRARPGRCWRYQALADGLSAKDASPLTLASAWRLLSRASVDRTVYRLVADLDTGQLELDRRSGPRSSRWRPRARLDVAKLLAMARPARRRAATAGATSR